MSLGFKRFICIYAWVLQVVSFSQIPPPKPCTHFSCPL